jgi:NAD(P)-dependent dehydrogenase (short-subunit alcohol dehydrogenase family)
LGKETVLQLAKHNPREIFLAARTPSKAEAAIDEIKQLVPGASVSYLKLDLTSFQSIKDAAKEFTTRSDRLDILINNAGMSLLQIRLRICSLKPDRHHDDSLFQDEGGL